jgi:hypothetical protein
MARFFHFIVVLIFLTIPARADTSAVIDRWYSALLVADRTELSDLLADNARIKLNDVGVEQSKAEFIASMDEWRGAVAGAAIRHRIAGSQGGMTTVIACYDFPGNDMLTQETFSVSKGHITSSTQARIADSCEGY